MPNILVIDDEEAVGRMIKQALTRSGFDVETASNGLEGIKKLDDGCFDVVITDIVMPEFDGHCVVRHIHNSKTLPPTVVGISGTPWLLEADGFDAVLVKPFSIKTLVDTLKRLAPASSKENICYN